MTPTSRNTTRRPARLPGFAKPRVRLACTALLCLAMLAETSCSIFEPEKRIPLTQDLRIYASQARARVSRLSPRQRAVVEPALRAHEHAIARYDRLMAQGQSRRRLQAPLIATGAFIVADDVTGFGVADDVVLPFLALAAVAAALATDAPASGKALQDAYQSVRDTAEQVSKALESSPVDDSSSTEASKGTRQTCIDLYVDCQENGHRSFHRSGCQRCMDLCMGNEYNWPTDDDCDYLKPRYRPLRQRIKW